MRYQSQKVISALGGTWLFHSYFAIIFSWDWLLCLFSFISAKSIWKFFLFPNSSFEIKTLPNVFENDFNIFWILKLCTIWTNLINVSFQSADYSKYLIAWILSTACYAVCIKLKHCIQFFVRSWSLFCNFLCSIPTKTLTSNRDHKTSKNSHPKAKK